MSPRFGPPPLLLLVLCYLMLPPALGFPVRGGAASRRELTKSASGDDLISGSDFLSVFIGASITPRSGRTRNLNNREKVGDDPEQSIGSFGERTIPRHTNTLSSTDGESHSQDKSEIERFEDLSSSNPPSDEIVSFASENMGRKPLQVTTSPHAINLSDSDIDFQSESLGSSSKRNEPSKSDTPGYFSSATTDEIPSYSKISSTTVESSIVDVSSSLKDNNSDLDVTTPVESNSEYTVVTDIVTSKEELLAPTESYDLLFSEDSITQDHDASESNSNHRTYAELSNHQREDTESQNHQNTSVDSDMNKNADTEFEDNQEEDQNSSSVPVTTPSVHVHHSSAAGVTQPGRLSTTFSQFSTTPTESTRITITSDADTNSRQQSQPVQQVVSVRVSSSVVQGPSLAPFSSRHKSFSRFDSGKIAPKPYSGILSQSPETAISDEDMQKQIDRDPSVSTSQSTHAEPASIDTHQPQPLSTSLVTEEQPAATAVQRSHFIVEESSPSSSEVSAHRPSSFTPNLQEKIIATVVETSRDPHSPVSYHTSVSSATSGSRVRYYSGPPSYHRGSSSVAETVQNAVVTRHHGSSGPHYEQVSGGSLGHGGDMPIESHMGRYGEPHHDIRISSPSLHQHTSFSTVSHSHPFREQMKPENAREQKSFQPHHQEPVEKNYEVQEQNYGQPERAYGVPERNYEVDEAVSVMTNGRAQGIQPTTPAGLFLSPIYGNLKLIDTPRHNSGKDTNVVVVDEKNYRKYQVEEHTSDGFIVGEFGVVDHGDGSLRGVRYTADGTINRDVINDALVKFLSL